MLRTQARFPDVPAGKGHYESFYLKACHPSEPLGVWIRYTVHKHSGRSRRGRSGSRSSTAAPAGPRASKVTTPDVSSAPEGAYIRIADSTFEDGPRRRAARRPSSSTRSWELSFSSDEEPLFHLARDWMYRAPVPKTKLLTPVSRRALRRRRARGRAARSPLEGWRGMVGHNWGTQHAERWIWLHGVGFEEAERRLARRGDRQDQARPRDHAVDRKRDALRRRRAAPARRAREGPLDAGDGDPDALRLPAARRRRDGQRPRRVGAEELRRMGLRGPRRAGAQHRQLLDRRHDADRSRPTGSPDRELHLRAGAAYELGMRETDHGMPLQPFPDG